MKKYKTQLRCLLEHYTHPLHLWCRLVDMGLCDPTDKEFYNKIDKYYGNLWRKLLKYNK